MHDQGVAQGPGDQVRDDRIAAARFAVYQWPIYFFVAVAFWNLVGAGLFGFLINPPALA